MHGLSASLYAARRRGAKRWWLQWLAAWELIGRFAAADLCEPGEIGPDGRYYPAPGSPL